MTESTINRPSQFDALEKARPDELIFTLLERDHCAPPTILHWCDLRRVIARELTDDAKRKAELQQITEAEFIAISMAARQKGSKAQADQMPKQTYSGNVQQRTAAEELMPRLRAELAEADYHTNNALELARQARELGLIDDVQLGHIGDCAHTIHVMALELSPHRARLMAEAELPLAASDD